MFRNDPFSLTFPPVNTNNSHLRNNTKKNKWKYLIYFTFIFFIAQVCVMATTVTRTAAKPLNIAPLNITPVVSTAQNLTNCSILTLSPSEHSNENCVGFTGVAYCGSFFDGSFRLFSGSICDSDSTGSITITVTVY